MRGTTTMIERIDIRLLESIGLEQRGNFYDPIGTLRDVGQNHLLAMLMPIAMDYRSDWKRAPLETTGQMF